MIFPSCPLADCAGTVVYAYSIGKGIYETKYYRCPMCGELMTSRKLTKAELAQKRAKKAARKARKTQKELLAEYKAERALLEALPQLPVEGWSPREWFPNWEEGETGQMRLDL